MTLLALKLLKAVIALLAIVGFLAIVKFWFSGKKSPAAVIFFVIGVTAGFLFYVNIRFIETNWIQVRHVKIHDEALAKVLGPCKIVQISDIHLTQGIGFREKQLVKKVNGLRPDILIFTGDLIDDRSQIGPAIELFKQFKPRVGIYAVPGNTDHIVMSSAELVRAMEPAGINWLINETRKLRIRPGYFLWIVGVDDPKYGYADLKKALEDIPSDVPRLMIAHSPVAFDLAVQERMNLLLVGDTHGGQVGIDFLVRMSHYANRGPYMRGLFEKGTTKMYINRGIGTKELSIRLLCRPEITEIEAN